MSIRRTLSSGKVFKSLLTCSGLLAISLALSSCDSSSGQTASVTVLYTNDEHGWMEGMKESLGAANLFALWQQQEGYSPDGDFLILSGGDNWTGPAISTLTSGESMVEVMNAMQYDASAVGNHEFDFGLDALRQRTREADFPYLSANILDRQSNTVAEHLGILPYTIREVAGVRAGIIGLTTRNTPSFANSNYVSELTFADYEQVLRDTVPSVRAAGVDLLLVISHVCVAELEPLIRNTQDLQIDMVGAGHCNESLARRIGNTVLLGGGFHFNSYARATFSVDTATGQTVASDFATFDNRDVDDAPALSSLINDWSALVPASLSEVIAYADKAYARSTGELNQAIADSWLWADPSADVAITNAGGIRIDLPAGEIDLNTIMTMMPFDNTIVALELSGASIVSALEQGSRPVVAGLRQQEESWILESTGAALQPQQRYRVLVNSFMYAGGDHYEVLASDDPDGIDTGIHYRQPFQDWLRAQESSSDNPLSL